MPYTLIGTRFRTPFEPPYGTPERPVFVGGVAMSEDRADMERIHRQLHWRFMPRANPLDRVAAFTLVVAVGVLGWCAILPDSDAKSSVAFVVSYLCGHVLAIWTMYALPAHLRRLKGRRP